MTELKAEEMLCNVESGKVRRCAYCDKILSEDALSAYCCAEHEELRRLYNKEYYDTHKTDLIKKSSNYIKDHPDIKKEINQRYYANLTDEQREARNLKRRIARNASNVTRKKDVPAVSKKKSPKKHKTPKDRKKSRAELLFEIRDLRKLREAAGKEYDIKELIKDEVIEDPELETDVENDALSVPFEVMLIQEKNKTLQDAIKKTREVYARNKGLDNIDDSINDEVNGM